MTDPQPGRAKLDVVSIFRRVAEYLDALDTNPAADRQQLYQQIMLDPVWSQYLAESELAERVRPMLMVPLGDREWLTQAAGVVNQAQIHVRIEDAFRDSAALLSGPDTTIGLFPLGPEHPFFAYVTEQMHGVIGVAAGGGQIALLINPASDWSDWVSYTVAHEYHHSAWRAAHPQYGDFSLLEYLVFEGKADSFAGIVAPGVVAPWTAALDGAEERDAWRMMQPQLDNRDRAGVLRFILGGDGLPHLAGYRIGYLIVQAYLRRHPEVAVEQWTALAPQELLQQSGYRGGSAS